MQCNAFATIVCEIATKFLYPVAKLQLDLFVYFEPWQTQSLLYIIYSLKFYSSVLTSLLSVKWSLLIWNLLCIFGDSLPLNNNNTKNWNKKLMGSILYKWMLEHVRNKMFSNWVPIPFWPCDSNFPFLSISLIDFVLLQRKHKEVIQATIFIKSVETLEKACTAVTYLTSSPPNPILVHHCTMQLFIPSYEITLTKTSLFYLYFIPILLLSYLF